MAVSLEETKPEAVPQEWIPTGFFLVLEGGIRPNNLAVLL